MPNEPTAGSHRDRLIRRLNELANAPVKSRTRRDIDELKELLEVMNLKAEVYAYPMQQAVGGTKLTFDLAQLEDEIDQFEDPRRRRLIGLRQDVEIATHERTLDEFKKPIPWKLYGIGGLALVAFMLVVRIATMTADDWQQLLQGTGAFIVCGVVAFFLWAMVKLFNMELAKIKTLAFIFVAVIVAFFIWAKVIVIQ